MSNIDAIRSRLEALMRHAGSTDYAGQVIADNIALVAEVERLRGEVDRERAAVVAWLRACEDESCVFADDIASQFAAEIERGDHRREGAE